MRVISSDYVPTVNYIPSVTNIMKNFHITYFCLYTNLIDCNYYLRAHSTLVGQTDRRDVKRFSKNCLGRVPTAKNHCVCVQSNLTTVSIKRNVHQKSIDR